MHKPADDLQLSLHTARQAAHGLEDVGSKPDHLGQVANLAAVRGRHQAVESAVRIEAVEDGVEANVLLAGEVHVQRRVLEDDADLMPDRARLANDVKAGDSHGP